MNKFPISLKAKIVHRQRNSHTIYLGGVSYCDSDGMQMNTVNEKIRTGIDVLCRLLGIEALQVYTRWIHNNQTTYYREYRAFDDPRCHTESYYTAQDFLVVLSSRLDARLNSGEALKK